MAYTGAHTALAVLATFFFAGGFPQASPPQQTAGRSTASAPNLAQSLADHNWPALGAALEATSDPDAGFYRGILLNHQGKYSESIGLLQPLLSALAAAPDRLREKQARMALGSDYQGTFQYKLAAEQYKALAQCCAAALSESEKDEVELPSVVLPLLQNAPAQALELGGPFSIPTERSPLGVREIPVIADGYPNQWLFDPSANFSELTRSLAKHIGLKLSAESVTVPGVTGAPIKVRVTVIPQLKFGQAFFRNVPAIVCEDADLYDKLHRYQIEGVVAQPLWAALGTVTSSDDGRVTISDKPFSGQGAAFFADGPHIVVDAGAQGARQLYEVDPGTPGSMLSSRYYDRHREAFAGQKPRSEAQPDASGSAAIPVYTAAELTLVFGETAATFHDIPVLSGSAGAEYVDGTLGENALDQLESFTLDFRSMRFAVKTHAEQ